MISSRVSGIVKGCGCEGIDWGSGGNFDGTGRERRGASRRGSTCFLYVVKISGRSRGFLKGMSRLDKRQLC